MTERLPSSSSVSTGDSPYLDAAAAEEEMQTESGEQLEGGAVAAVAENSLPRIVTSRHSARNQPPAGDDLQQSEEMTQTVSSQPRLIAISRRQMKLTRSCRRKLTSSSTPLLLRAVLKSPLKRSLLETSGFARCAVRACARRQDCCSS